VYQTLLAPECLDVFNATSSLRPSWETVESLEDYTEAAGEWYTGRNGSNASDDNTNYTTQGKFHHLPLHSFVVAQGSL
jgi:hypothetical protein